jgi:hypothetical protein
MHSFLTYEGMELLRERYWAAGKLPLCNRIKGFDTARCTILHFLWNLWTAYWLSGEAALNVGSGKIKERLGHDELQRDCQKVAMQTAIKILLTPNSFRQNAV